MTGMSADMSAGAKARKEINPTCRVAAAMT
jgi:hypothetical protein